MRIVKYPMTAGILYSVLMLLASCAGNTTDTPAEKKTITTDSTPKPRWNDPQRGKIFSKENYVQIPLTAYENHIFGAVKSVTYNEYKVSDKGEKSLEDSGYNVYDKAGHLTDQNEYGKDGKAKWNCIYKYDNQNRATLWSIKVYGSKMNSEVTFKYDDKGRKIEQNEAAAKKEESRRLVYKYDDKGNKIEEEEYYGDKKAPWLTTYKYDRTGNQIEYAHKDETGRILSKMTQVYDSLGNKAGGAYYTSDTVISGKWVAKNDNLGRMIEGVYFKKDGSLQSKRQIKYDEWDNITEIISYKADGSIDTAGWNAYVEYEYDSKGNAVKETGYKLKGGKKIMTDLAERKFEYY